MEEFRLNENFIQLCDLLKAVGLCESGGQAKHVIGDGLVKVDNKVETRKRCKIREGQIVEFEGQLIKIVAQ